MDGSCAFGPPGPRSSLQQIIPSQPGPLSSAIKRSPRGQCCCGSSAVATGSQLLTQRAWSHLQMPSYRHLGRLSRQPLRLLRHPAMIGFVACAAAERVRSQRLDGLLRAFATAVTLHRR